MTKRRALGQGLNALFGEEVRSIEEVDLNQEKISEIDLTELRANPYQPRRTFEPEALAELAASIKKEGVFQPIIVRKSSIKGYEIIAGERRFRASKLAHKEKIPAIVRDVSDEAMMQIAVLENLQREDLNPMEEAQAYNMLMNNLGLTQEKVAERLGKTRSYIANYLRLLSLPADVKVLVQDGKLEKNKARALLGLRSSALISEMAKKAVEQELNTRQIERLVKEKNEGKKKASQSKNQRQEKPFYLRESENLLTDKLGTLVNIKDLGKKGKIEIEYVSHSDLTRILDILGIRAKD